MMKLYDVIRKERGEMDIAPVHSTPHLPPESPQKISWKKVTIVGGVLALLALIYMVGIRFVHAQVIVEERRVPFSLEHEVFELSHEKDATSGRLSFQTMVVSEEISREVYGSDAVPSMTNATGSVIFFNEYSKSSQTIKSKTTLTAPTGKKYQTTQSVTVPGYKTSGSTKNPGTSVATPIIAVDVGSSYNSPGTSFTVSGWPAKGLYAQSVGALTGGDTGVAHLVSTSERAKVIATLEAQLTERLKRETRAQIPDTLVTFPELQFISIDDQSLVLKGSSIRFPAKIKGTMVTYLISRDMLERAIAARTIQGTTYPSVTIPTLTDLDVAPTVAVPTSATNVPDAIKISISGNGMIITKAPLIKIREMLVGARQNSFSLRLGEVPEVSSAQFTLTPFWSPFFPSRIDRISISTK